MEQNTTRFVIVSSEIKSFAQAACYTCGVFMNMRTQFVKRDCVFTSASMHEVWQIGCFIIAENVPLPLRSARFAHVDGS